MSKFINNKILAGVSVSTRNVIKIGKRNVQIARLPQELVKAKEITIPVPWGHIAGKLWGPENTRPILGLHGWQDNAGTFNTLAPLLPPHISLLAIDFPGHGLSSRIPDGLMYSTHELVVILRRIQLHYNWDKISLMGHSMGSIAAFLYSSIYPDLVDFSIGIDALKPHISPSEKFTPMFRKKVEDFIKIDTRNLTNSEPPSYSIEEMIERWHQGTNKSVDKDKCFNLLERTIGESKTNPDKYYFTRDNRLKAIIFSGLSQEICLALAKNIRTPFLAIKATKSPYYEDKRYYDETIEVMKQNELFEHREIEGTHHVHLNEPEKLRDVINTFILKYRPNT